MVGAGEVPDSKAGSLPPRPRTLLCWMWRSYLRTALVPLLVVELALIAAYFASNALTKEANIATARATAEESLAEIARLNAELAAERLATVTELTRMLQRRRPICPPRRWKWILVRRLGLLSVLTASPITPMSITAMQPASIPLSFRWMKP